jgi:hypothetical protein
MEKELERIRRAAAALETDLRSTDEKVAAAAEKKLKQAATDLKALAKAHGIKLTQHTEPSGDPEARRRCAPVISTVINGKIQMCVFVGKEGRNCLYSCSPATMTPTS